MVEKMIKTVKKLMIAADQTVDVYNEKQMDLYKELIEEEIDELYDSITNEDQLDAVIDLAWVALGYAYSMGADVENAIKEVERSNKSKINPETGKLDKDENGKYTKGVNYTKPNLKPYL